MGMSFLKKGIESAKAVEQEKAKYEAAKSEMDKAFRFFMAEQEKGVYITFVDGELDPEHGVLLPPRCWGHMVQLGSKWYNVVCPQEQDPSLQDTCPICQGGGKGSKPALCSFFTVIDHRVTHSKDGKKTYQNQRKLFAAKSQTMEELNSIAIKRGGLAGCRFEVRRQGEKAAAVGSHFDFESKTPIAELQSQYVEKVTHPTTGESFLQTYFLPLDYEGKEITYRTGNELRQMGFGGPSVAGFNGQPNQALTPGGVIASKTTDYNKVF